MTGRPLRFLAVTMGGWVALRIVALWPTVATVERGFRNLVSPPAAAAAVAPMLARSTTRAPPAVLQKGAEPAARKADLPRPMPAKMPLAGRTMAKGEARIEGRNVTASRLVLPPAILPLVAPDAQSRWHVSAWAMLRGGATPLLGAQLGGSQAGVRAVYTLDRANRVALAARIATPIETRGREAAIGIDWQPTAAPVHLIAEQRFGLDGNRGGPTLMVIGGLDKRPVAAGLALEGYGEAGVIARDGGIGFADGAVRLTHRIARRDRLRVDLGLGAWGGVQPGAARIDIGPSLGIVLPVADKAVRLTLDWRARIAGDAAPGSGPALSIGSDF